MSDFTFSITLEIRINRFKGSFVYLRAFASILAHFLILSKLEPLWWIILSRSLSVDNQVWSSGLGRDQRVACNSPGWHLISNLQDFLRNCSRLENYRRNLCKLCWYALSFENKINYEDSCITIHVYLKYLDVPIRRRNTYFFQSCIPQTCRRYKFLKISYTCTFVTKYPKITKSTRTLTITIRFQQTFVFLDHKITGW